MQKETVKETEGVIAIRRLQSGGYKVWRREEIENLSDVEKDILEFIGEEDNKGKPPWQQDIFKKITLSDKNIRDKLKKLKEKEMAFSVAIEEIVKCYGLEYLGYSGRGFNLPEHLGWLDPYLEEISGSWTQKLNSARSSAYRLYWIALIENEDCLPSYLPLGLHIPKQ